MTQTLTRRRRVLLHAVSDRALGTTVAGVLAVDACLHLYWATGTSWPAPDLRAASDAVLGTYLYFTPPVLLPIATLLLCGAAAVFYRSRSELVGRSRRLDRLSGAATMAVAFGLSVRAFVGLIWAAGIGVVPWGVFDWLNRALYTPLCLVLAALTWEVVRRRRTGRMRVPLALLGVTLALVGAIGYLAYGYRPPVVTYRSPAAAGDAYVETPLARFHYVREGSGSPVVLLSPGETGTFAWQPEVDVLRRNHTVYVVDLPGQGFTALHQHDFGYDIPAMTHAVETFLDALHLPKVALAGSSWSGGWALAFAQDHPARVSQLALLAPSGLAQPDAPSFEVLKIPMLGEAVNNIGPAMGGVARGAVEDLFVHKDLVTDALLDEFLAPNTEPATLDATVLLERRLDWQVTQRALPTTRTPTLVIWGAQDTVLPVTQAATFRALLPSAAVHVLPDCGHALTLDCPTEIGPLMADFLR